MKKRKAKLEDAMRLHQLFRDIEDEESWIREKEPVAQSQARGKDLIGAQKLLKKHHALIAEIDAHEDSLNKVGVRDLIFLSPFTLKRLFAVQEVFILKK